jgi:hypothetical protein
MVGRLIGVFTTVGAAALTRMPALFTAIFPPSAAKRREKASPSPDAPPVTRATSALKFRIRNRRCNSRRIRGHLLFAESYAPAFTRVDHCGPRMGLHIAPYRRIRSAARQARAITGPFMPDDTCVGITEQSTTRNRSTPRTRNSGSVTASASDPMRHVPAEW